MGCVRLCVCCREFLLKVVNRALNTESLCVGRPRPLSCLLMRGCQRHVLRSGRLKVPSALALVPGLGLVVRDNRVHVFATPDVIAMAAMSACRVAWMVGVVRGLARRGARGDSVTT